MLMYYTTIYICTYRVFIYTVKEKKSKVERKLDNFMIILKKTNLRCFNKLMDIYSHNLLTSYPTFYVNNEHIQFFITYWIVKRQITFHIICYPCSIVLYTKKMFKRELMFLIISESEVTIWTELVWYMKIICFVIKSFMVKNFT